MQNRTEFNAEQLWESLKQFEFLNGKVFHEGVFIKIVFHKYLDIKICDDMFEFFDTHCHPYNNEEILQYIEDLIDEKIIFYHKYKFPYRMKRYEKHDLPMLLATKNKKYCRVFSANKIYIDN